MNLDYIDEESRITIPYMPDAQQGRGMFIKALSQEKVLAHRYSHALNALINTASELLNCPTIPPFIGERHPVVTLPTAVVHELKRAAYACTQCVDNQNPEI